MILAPVVRLRIWDAPVRLFHAALIILLGLAWWTAEQGEIEWHRFTGYTVMGLILFRIGWGIVGSTTALFWSFLASPSRVVSYVRNLMFDQSKTPVAGHNPVGGWSVVLILGLVIVQLFLGLLAVDIDGLESGPFSYLVDFETGRIAAEWHERVFSLLQIACLIHIAAVLFYLLYRRENLIVPMITGSRNWYGEKPVLRFVSSKRAALLMLASGTLVGLIVWLWGRA